MARVKLSMADGRYLKIYVCHKISPDILQHTSNIPVMFNT